MAVRKTVKRRGTKKSDENNLGDENITQIKNIIDKLNLLPE